MTTPKQFSFDNTQDSQLLLQKLKRIKKAELHIHFRGCLQAELLYRMMLPLQSHHTLRTKGLLYRFPQDAQSMITQSAHVHAFIQSWPHMNSPHKLLQSCQSLFQFQQPYDFFMTYLMTAGLWESPEEMYPLADHIVHYCKEHHIIYAEMIFSVSEYILCGWSIENIVRLLSYAQSTAEKQGIQLRWIFDFVRNFPEQGSLQRLENLLSHDIPGWIGITLGGEEDKYPAKDFQELYRLAADNHLRLTCHAGEHASHTSVEDAIKLLHCERIGHGIASAQSEYTMRLLKERKITLEICPSSNVQTLACKDFTQHPAYKLFSYGIPISIASDDPGFFQTSLTEELLICITDLGFNFEDILTTIRQGFISAFAEESKKKAMLQLHEASCKSALT